MELYKKAYKKFETLAVSTATIFGAFVLVYSFAISFVHPGRFVCSSNHQIGCQSFNKKLANPSDTFSIIFSCILMAISLFTSIFVIFSSGAWSSHRRLTKVVSLISILAVILSCFMVFAPYAHRSFVAPFSLAERGNYEFAIEGTNVTLTVNDSKGLFEKAGMSHVKLVITEAKKTGVDDRNYLVDVSTSRKNKGIQLEPSGVVSLERPVAQSFSLSWTFSGLKDNKWYIFFLSKVTSDGKYEVSSVVEAPFKRLANGEKFEDKKLLIDVRPFVYCLWANEECVEIY